MAFQALNVLEHPDPHFDGRGPPSAVGSTNTCSITHTSLIRRLSSRPSNQYLPATIPDAAVPDFDPKTQLIIDRDFFQEMQHRLHHALSKFKLREEDVAQLRQRGRPTRGFMLRSSGAPRSAIRIPAGC